MVVRFRAVAAVAVIFCLGQLTWLTLQVGGPAATHLAARAAVAAASLFTAAACGFTAFRSGADARRGWGMLSSAGVCWLLANGMAWYQEHGTGRSLPVPSPTNLASVSGLVLPVIALLAFLAPALRRPARLRTLLDSLLVTGALLYAVWAVVPERQYREGHVADLVYPLVDIVLVSLVVAAVTRVRRAARLPWALLLTGLTLLAVGHVAFTYLQVAHPSSLEGFTTSSWIAGCVVLGLAALARGSDLMPVSGDTPPTGLLPVLVPYAPLGLAVGVALLHQSDLGVHPLLQVDGGVVFALLLGRQVVTHVEAQDRVAVLDADVMERTAELARQERHFRSLARNASDVVTVVDADNVIRFQSASVERVLGFAPGELVGSRIEDLLHPDERVETLGRLRSAPPSPALPSVVESRLRHRHRGWCLAETAVTNLLGDDSVRGILLTSRDVAERKRVEHELRHQALHDPLTGLANRTLLRDRLEHAVARCRRGPESVALVMVDLDDFKLVNDTRGHPAGDRVLVEVARRLLQSVRTGDTVARMGGDEFAILLERADDVTLALVADRVLRWPRAPIQFDGTAVAIQASVGVATTAGIGPGAEELLRNADLAMYAAKSKGKGSYEVYRPSMHTDAVERERREAALHRALRDGELVLHYQPVVDLATGWISGAEALVRWDHPDRGLMLPGEFLPLAEQSELVTKIGRFALGEACRQARHWQRSFPPMANFTMAVNVAPTRQLTNLLLAREVQGALEESELQPGSLVLEFSARALAGDVASITPTLHALKELGIQLALDDFGEGPSSLGGLRSLPVDKLKIDRSLVQEIRSSDGESSIVTAIIAVARSMGVSTVAEGVESFDQLACLQANGCHEAQGFLLSVPLPPAEFEALLVDTGGVVEVAAVVRRDNGELAKAPSA